MKYPILGFSLLLFLSWGSLAQATPLGDKIDAFKKAIRAEIAERPKTAPGQPNPNMSSAGMEGRFGVDLGLDQISQQMEPSPDGDPETDLPQGGDPAAIVRQLLTMFSSEDVQKTGNALLDEIRLERKARDDAYADKVEAILKRVAEVLPKAQLPADLDSLIVDLQKYQNRQGYGRDERQRDLSQKAASIYQFVVGWQDYLFNRANGKKEEVQNNLRNLAQNGYGITIIPRSEILARMQESTNSAGDVSAPKPSGPTQADVLSHIKTLDDIEPTLPQLAAFHANAEENANYDKLMRISSLYTALKNGLPADFELEPSNNWPVPLSPDVNRLKAQLLLLFFRSYFNLSDPPAADDTPNIVLTRVIADAQKKEDWLLLHKAVKIQEAFNKFNGEASNPASGLESFLTADNQDKAGQYIPAVMSYEAALKSLDSYTPVKLIGERLAAIQRDHPNEYKTAFDQLLNPPQPRMPYGGYGFPVPNFQRMPNPGVPAPTPGTVLSIPGATTNAAPTPAPPTTNSAPATNAAPATPPAK
jgi:hypothetical protein